MQGSRLLVFIIAMSLWARMGRADDPTAGVEDANPAPVPMMPSARQGAPVPFPSGALAPLATSDSIDRDRLLTQWFTIYGFGGVLSRGQKLAGGGIKIARLRMAHAYLTIANLTFAATPLSSEHAAYFGYYVQSGGKVTAGADGQHVFYFGVEAGIGAFGYDIKTSTGHRTHTAMTNMPISPHIEYNYHYANHGAFIVELNVIPPLIDGRHSAVNGEEGVIGDSPPWLFGMRMGMAF